MAHRQQGTPVMLTQMTEDDWAITLQVFAAAQSRRGQSGRNDRKFLEALHFFTVHNLTWRALPATFGPWNSIWKRFWRLSQTGVFEAFFQLLAETSKTAHLVQMLDSTVVRAHVSAAGAKGGQKNQALGRSRGGFSSKIHLKTDFDGLPIGFHLTGGEVSDSTQLATSLDIGPDITPRAVMTDKGYDAKSNRAACRERGIIPVIPHRSNTKNKPNFFPKRLYRGRARIEQAIGKLKRFKRIAMRCEKTATNFAAFVAFACGLILVKSVHRA
jgi:transposase